MGRRNGLGRVEAIRSRPRGNEGGDERPGGSGNFLPGEPLVLAHQIGSASPNAG
jgi:hypothetical protein